VSRTRDAHGLTVGEVLEQWLEGHDRLCPILRLVLMTGMRRG
jgi:hypothetical protein